MVSPFEGTTRREKVDGELAAMDGGGGMMADGKISWEQGREEKTQGKGGAG
jgi:hypothetical protein